MTTIQSANITLKVITFLIDNHKLFTSSSFVLFHSSLYSTFMLISYKLIHASPNFCRWSWSRRYLLEYGQEPESIEHKCLHILDFILISRPWKTIKKWFNSMFFMIKEQDVLTICREWHHIRIAHNCIFGMKYNDLIDSLHFSKAVLVDCISIYVPDTGPESTPVSTGDRDSLCVCSVW